MNSIFKSDKGFTLVELMVVVAMIAILMASMSVSVTTARRTARVQKATAEVKVISQAILAYENFSTSGLQECSDAELNEGNFGYLLGEDGDAREGNQQIVLLQAGLTAGSMRDPWGTPYRVRITKGQIKVPSAMGTLQTGYMIPNIDRISKEER